MTGRARPVAALVLALVAAVGALWFIGHGPAQPAGAQILDPDDTTTTTAPEETSTTVVPTTAPTTTEAPTTTATTTTTAPPTTAPPATRAPATTDAPTTTAPPAPTTSAPPGAPTTASTTTVPVDTRQRITQDTPALGGVIAVWLLGILGVVAILGAGWWRSRNA